MTHPEAHTTPIHQDPRLAFAAEPVVDLAGARVAVLGAGSVGSLVAWCLASRGVGRLELADRDRLAADNLRRHPCGRAELDQAKAVAVGDFLEQRFAQVTLRPHAFCFLDDPAQLRELLAGTEIAVVAVDEEGPKYLIDSMTRELGTAAVYAGVYGGGWGAEVVLVDPRRATPCYGCAARRLGRGGVTYHTAAMPANYALPAPSVEASGWHQADLSSIMPTAALAARLVVAWLEAQRGHERPLQDFQLQRGTAWRLALRHVEPWALGPWELASVPVRSQPQCPLCGPQQTSLAPGQFQQLLKGQPS